MMFNRVISLCAAAAVLVSGGTAAADESASLADAVTSGKAGLNVRARYETVDQDGIDDQANAVTARLRLNYTTGEWRRLGGFLEYDYVFHLLDDFNSGAGTSPGKANFPVVADPKGPDLNQLYLDYRFNSKTKGRLGRQRILLDNQRFVGGVGWRQNEQTYDAVSFSTKAIDKTEFFYGYVGRVRRIFGDSVPAGAHKVDSHLLNAKITINEAWSLTPYYYYIDNEDAAAFSTATLGARLVGTVNAGPGKLALLAEFAKQSDAGNNPVDFDADYAHLSGTWSSQKGLSLGLSYELLGGDELPGRAFRTPLATLHAFQGWADKFLTTPDAGIQDVFVTAKYKAGRWNLTGIYHDFTADAGSADYGSELDLSAATRISDNYSILFKGAFFSGDNGGPADTNKFWIMFTANY